MGTSRAIPLPPAPIPESLPDGKSHELEYLKFAIDQAASISVSDTAGNIIFVNDRFLETTRYERAEVIGANHRLLNSGFHDQEFFAGLWSTISAGRIWKGEVRNRAKDGSFFWMDTTIIPFLGADRKPFQFMAIRHDITRQKEAESQLEEERAKYLYSERLAALGEMQAGIAHEIKNPLAAIQMQAQVTKRALRNGAVTTEYLVQSLERIEGVVKRIEKIIAGLQAFSRNAESDPFERVSLRAVAEEAVDFCRAGLAKRNIEVSNLVPKDLFVYCRPAQISQVLLNLINNARDALEGFPDRWIRLQGEAEGSRIYLSVSDSGPGIPVAIAEKIMRPFFSTKAPGKGSGLGLSISRRIMEDHGGKLRLDSDSAHTRFVLEFRRR